MSSESSVESSPSEAGAADAGARVLSPDTYTSRPPSCSRPEVGSDELTARRSTAGVATTLGSDTDVTGAAELEVTTFVTIDFEAVGAGTADTATEIRAPAEPGVEVEAPAELGAQMGAPAGFGVEAEAPAELETESAIAAPFSVEIEDVVEVAVSTKGAAESNVDTAPTTGSGTGATAATELGGDGTAVVDEAEATVLAESGVITEAATTPNTEAGTAAVLGEQTTNSAELAAESVDTATDRDDTSTAEPTGIQIAAWTGKADPGAVASELEVAEPVVSSHDDEQLTTAGSNVGAAETTVVTAVLKVAATGPEVAVVTLESNELETGSPPSEEVEVNAASVKGSTATSSAGLPASKSGNTSSLAELEGRPGCNRATRRTRTPSLGGESQHAQQLSFGYSAQFITSQ
ncbi:unnamed protein product [Phytophthora fragariaefolia]|uniref:Unnamed protein product n=1 Tax=Phytophthora fragariaefolia TaxID=1490495 RepID=A0A9W7CN39_9STRA|nr:unnamed protein product [Phytophthora fragariaefolia]